MNNKWIRFKNKFPELEDFPIWVFDEEFKHLELVYSDEDRIFPRQWCIKKELMWQKASFINPILPQPERSKREDHHLTLDNFSDDPSSEQLKKEMEIIERKILDAVL